MVYFTFAYKFMQYVHSLSMQWPDVNQMILDDPLLDVCLS